MVAAPSGSPVTASPRRGPPGIRIAGLFALLAVLLLAYGLGANAATPSTAVAPHRAGVVVASIGVSGGTSGTVPSTPFFGQAANLSSVSMVYDSHDGDFVAVAEQIGPGTSYGAKLETWTFSNPNATAPSGNWTELAPAASPPARIGASLAYDSQNDGVVLFGGLGPSGYLSDTWMFSGGNWTNLTASAGQAPPARADSSFTWDSAASYAVLYDGVGARGWNWSNPMNGTTATWLFYSQAWHSVYQASSSVPPSRGAMAYDALDGYLLYVGGSDGAAPCGTATTFSFVSGSWTNLTGAVQGAPPARIDPSVTYDSAANRIVLFGGQDCVAYQSSTYSYSGATWSLERTPVAPSARSGAAIAFDDILGASVLFGGISVNGHQSDTWSYATGAGWVHRGPLLTLPGTIVGANGSTADVGTNLTLEVDGAMAVGPTNFTYSGLPSSCPAATGSSFVCPATTAGHYTLGGAIESSIGSATLPGTPLLLNVPPSVTSFNLSSTETEPQVPVTLTVAVAGGTAPYSYNFTGLPAGCATADQYWITCSPTATGSFPVTVTATDADGEHASQTVGLVVGPYPFLNSVSVTSRLIDIGQSTEITLVAGGGSGPLTYTYTNLPAGCTSANTTNLVCAPTVSGTFVVAVHATDAYGYTATRLVQFQIDPQLVAASLTTNVSDVVFGHAVSIALVVNGGTSPIFITYNGLPSGCESENATDFACTPRVEGSFLVRATVIDGLNETSAINYTMVVVAPALPITPPNPNGGGGSAATGAALWFTLGIGFLVVVIAVMASFGALVARGRAQARAGRTLAHRMIAEAPSLGRQYGPIDDPPRPR